MTVAQIMVLPPRIPRQRAGRSRPVWLERRRRVGSIKHSEQHITALWGAPKAMPWGPGRGGSLPLTMTAVSKPHKGDDATTPSRLTEPHGADQ